ncbi:hypothetical protein ZIOFF_053829 [Zingiber officinale]|uniref:NADPH--hemoprotein reductase n=1 Tax=Zingiber officinale TaxID=94328 RepID=A0A8J5FE30_ZINOF|nr:hypothetical protein ZIOFF_053829 [Zingiber officinale]
MYSDTDVDDDGKKKAVLFFGTQTGTDTVRGAFAEEGKARYEEAAFKVVDFSKDRGKWLNNLQCAVFGLGNRYEALNEKDVVVIKTEKFKQKSKDDDLLGFGEAKVTSQSSRTYRGLVITAREGRHGEENREDTSAREGRHGEEGFGEENREGTSAREGRHGEEGFGEENREGTSAREGRHCEDFCEGFNEGFCKKKNLGSPGPGPTLAVKELTSSIVKLDRFEGDNFIRGKKRVHFFLIALNVVYVLNTPKPTHEGEEEETLDEFRAKQKWETDDEICRGHILNAMGDNLLDIYHKVGTAKELWKKLEVRKELIWPELDQLLQGDDDAFDAAHLEKSWNLANGYAVHDIQHPCRTNVAVHQKLNTPASDRSCIHIEFEIFGTSLTYETGDHVEDGTSISGASLPAPFLSPCTSQTALTPSALHKPNMHRTLLERFVLLIVQDEYSQWIVVSQRSLIELMTEFPSTKPPLGVFFTAIARAYNQRSPIYLSTSLNELAVLQSRLRKQAGLAPFRGSYTSPSPILLFFSLFCEIKHIQDYIYEDELKNFVKTEALSELIVAFSREGPTKEYVQHKMDEKASDIWKINTQGFLSKSHRAIPCYFSIVRDARDFRNCEEIYRDLLIVQRRYLRIRYLRDVW